MFYFLWLIHKLKTIPELFWMEHFHTLAMARTIFDNTVFHTDKIDITFIPYSQNLYT